MLKIFVALLAVGLLIPAAFSAENRIEGPLSGYFFDAPTGSVRAIAGTPGAAWLADAVVSGFDAVWMAPGGRSSLALKDGVLGFVRYSGDAPSFTAFQPAPSGIDQVTWSPDGQGAALYSSARKVLQVVTGFPDRPALSPEIDLAQTGGAVSQLRLSALARHAAVIVNHGDAHSLYLLQDLGTATLVDLISDAGPMDFSSDGRSLYVIDRSANQLVKVPVSSPQDAQTIVLADSTIVPSAFASLLASADGKQLYATLPDETSVVALETTAWTTVFRTGLDFNPSSLERLTGSLYVLASPRERGSPVWLLNASTGNVYFVPARGQE